MLADNNALGWSSFITMETYKNNANEIKGELFSCAIHFIIYQFRGYCEAH